MKPKYKVGDFFIPIVDSKWLNKSKFALITKILKDEASYYGHSYNFTTSCRLEDNGFTSYFEFNWRKIGNIKDNKLIKLFYL